MWWRPQTGVCFYQCKFLIGLGEEESSEAKAPSPFPKWGSVQFVDEMGSCGPSFRGEGIGPVTTVTSSPTRYCPAWGRGEGLCLACSLILLDWLGREESNRANTPTYSPDWRSWSGEWVGSSKQLLCSAPSPGNLREQCDKLPACFSLQKLPLLV